VYESILHFWFEETKPSQWWVKDKAFDQYITDSYAKIHRQATLCECYLWRKTARGRLAEIIVLDQFSRNMYRDAPLSFASDAQALALTQEAVSIGADQQLTPIERSFLYLPFMHSESLLIHEQAVLLYQSLGLPSNLEFELKHQRIIEQFGRYPHRNAILGRQSTALELEFLQQADSSF
jgi:uncharacterized protein (DUF924 family)